MILFLLASTLLHLCRGHSLGADLHISEQGAEDSQIVKFDPITKAVSYQNDIVASTSIVPKPMVCSAQLDSIVNPF